MRRGARTHTRLYSHVDAGILRARVNPHARTGGWWAGFPINKPSYAAARCAGSSTSAWCSSPGKGASASRPSRRHLGVLGARRGRRTVVAELSSQDRDPAAVRARRRALRRGRDRARPVHDLDRSRPRDGRVPPRQGRRRRAHARLEPAVPCLHDGDPRDARAAEHRQGLGAVAVPAPNRWRRAVRPRDLRRAGDRARRRAAEDAPDVLGDRARRPDRASGAPDREDDLEPQVHRGRRGRDARGDAGQRDAVAARRARARTGSSSTSPSSTRSTRCGSTSARSSS